MENVFQPSPAEGSQRATENCRPQSILLYLTYDTSQMLLRSLVVETQNHISQKNHLIQLVGWNRLSDKLLWSNICHYHPRTKYTFNNVDASVVDTYLEKSVVAEIGPPGVGARTQTGRRAPMRAILVNLFFASKTLALFVY